MNERAVPEPASAGLVTSRTARQRWFIGLSVAGFALIFLQLLITTIFTGRFMPGVTVAQVAIGGMTRPEARQALLQHTKDYQFTVTATGKEYAITPEQVGVSYDTDATLDQAYQIGRTQLTLPQQLVAAKQHGDIGYSYQVDRAKELQFIQQLVQGSGQAPVDAAIVIQDGVPQVQPDKNGFALSVSEVEHIINRHIGNASREPVALHPTVETAHVTAKLAAKALEPTKQLLATPITLTYQGRSFTPKAADMSDWISYDTSSPDQEGSLTPKVNPDGIKHYLQSVAKAVNVNPVNRKLNVQDGNSQEMQAGKDGLQVDQDALAAQIEKAVATKQALTVEVPTKPVAFKTEYNRSVSLDYDKYIEVNLATQHLWVYQNHQVIYQSAITSGSTGTGHPTVEGLFSILAKQTNRNLNGYAIGYNYNVFVKYWMPFFADYGLHDASWRNGSFGGSDYYYGGSHGCVNLPEATAAFIFGWADVGTPVWVHH